MLIIDKNEIAVTVVTAQDYRQIFPCHSYSSVLRIRIRFILDFQIRLRPYKKPAISQSKITYYKNLIIFSP